MNMAVAMAVMICGISLMAFQMFACLDPTKYIISKIMNIDMRINRGSSRCYRLTFLRELPSIVCAFRFRVTVCLTGRVPYNPSSDCYKYLFSSAALT